MGLNKPSSQVSAIIGKIGELPINAEPNSRFDLFDEYGNLIQQRWFDANGRPIRNRDWHHGHKGGVHEFPHDHPWNWDKNPPRAKHPYSVDSNFK